MDKKNKLDGINPYYYVGIPKCDKYITFANKYFGFNILQPSLLNTDKLTRKQEYVFARNCLTKYLYENQDVVLQDIADSFGLTGHSNILHAYRTMDNDIETDKIKRDKWLDFEEKIKNEFVSYKK